jgi:ubiquinone/menaquinone biosynthesis C-methylase UbiE
MRFHPGLADFNRWAPRYDESVLQRLLFVPIQRAVLDAFDAAAPVPGEVLDVGCGTGRLVAQAAERWPGARFTGVDVSVEMIAAARRARGADGRFHFETADAAALPFPEQSFDAVFSTLSFHHWHRQERGLAEVARVLRPNGLFVLADIDPPLYSVLKPLYRLGGNAHPRPPSALNRLLLDAGFRIREQRLLRPLSQLVVARKVS